MYATRPRVQAELDESLSKSIETNEIKPRKHPGVMKINTVEVPASAVNAMQLILKDKPMKALNRDALVLSQYLHARHPPAEEEAQKDKAKKIEHQLESSLLIDAATLSEDEAEKFNKWRRSYVSQYLRHMTYNWQPVFYDENKALHYMLRRFAPEYAVLCRIFSELKRRDSDFQPRALFDFGSGLGTVTWAARSTWGNSIKEYFNVDSSVAMNDLASLLLRDGNENKNLPINGIFYRQFLPALQTLKYDIVVSAYSLFELPSAQSRLETLVNLWNKTQRYLVLVEQGTNAGFKLINEARNFILQLSEKREIHVSVPVAHVFSPCPHDLPCPRLQQGQIPCNFQVSYLPLPIAVRVNAKKEQFSYVVLKKGEKAPDDKQWPRIVEEPLVRRKHTVCRLCTTAGKLEEIVFTASKHGKIPYWCARSSNWGDLLPMTLSQVPDTEETHDDNVNNHEEK